MLCQKKGNKTYGKRYVFVTNPSTSRDKTPADVTLIEQIWHHQVHVFNSNIHKKWQNYDQVFVIDRPTDGPTDRRATLFLFFGISTF